MLIIPAIDLQAGRCVRLKQGQFNQCTQFDTPPIVRAQHFTKLGVKRLHVVDLDGAQQGTMQQLPLICAMQSPGLIIQAGGGIRTLAQAEECLAQGLNQLVIGSIAITDFQLTSQIISTIGAKRIVLAIDVKIDNMQPFAATHGWQVTSKVSLWDVVAQYEALGIKQVLCTDIACDGMMSGPNFNLYGEAVECFPNLLWQASGGIRHQKDLNQLADLGVHAAILGLTLYQGHFDLAEALKECAPC